MAQLMFPNIAGQVQQGFQQGQGMAFNRLAGLAMGSGDPNDPNLMQAAQIDPRDAMAIQSVMQQRQQQQQAYQQQQQMQGLQKVGGAARYMAQALQTKDPAQIQGAWENVRPMLAQMAAAQGKPPPPMQYDPSTEPGLYQLIAATASAFPNDGKLYNLAPGGQLVNGTGKTVASAPFKPAAPTINNGYQLILGPDGQYHYASVNPIGAPNGMGMGPAVPGARAGIAPPQAQAPNVGAPAQSSIIDNPVPPGTQVSSATGPDGTRVAFAFAPDTPDAVQTQTGAMAGVPQGASQAPSQGQPQTLAQVLANKGQMRTLSQDEVKAAGLPAGSVVQASPNGALHVVSKPGGQDGAPMVFGDATKTGADYLSTLDPQVASQVKALDEGRMQFPSNFALKTPYWQGMLAAVSRYDPSFDSVNYNARVSTRKAFTSGKEAQQVNALNTVAQHLAQLQGYANALGNYSFTPLNTAKNAIEGTMGNAAPTNFNRTVLPVAQELERVWRGTGGTEGDIKQWIANMSSSSSPAQFKDAFQGLSDLIYGKLAALRDQYVQGMGTTANPYQFLSPRTQAIFSHLDSIDAGKFANDATAGNNVTANAQTAAPSSGWSIQRVQ